MAIFNNKLLNYQRVINLIQDVGQHVQLISTVSTK